MSVKYLASTLVMLSAIVATTGAGQAAVVGTATLKANLPSVPFTAPETTLAAPWVSYRLTIQATAGEVIGGVEADIRGMLHQRWSIDEFGESIGSTYSLNQTNGDSHLMGISNLFFVSAWEDNNVAGSPLPDTATVDYGVGSYLRGYWGTTGSPTTVNVAYVVVPNNRLYELDIEVNVANSNGDIIGRLTERDFFPNVPEPASCWLLCAGLLAYAAASRRFCHRIQ